jgi:type IV secretory pathway VirB4 component
MDLGVRRDNGKKLDVDSQILARHAAMLGSTGSGKTVMAKALIEECTIDDIPSLIIDPQGIWRVSA